MSEKAVSGEFPSESLLRTNLDLLLKLAAPDIVYPSGFTPMILWTPSAPTMDDLPHDCDSPNRAMLDKLYELAQVDRKTTRILEEGERIAGSYGYHRTVILESPLNLRFDEAYATNGEWEMFRVMASQADWAKTVLGY